ncbi:MAG: DUF364 domain-containing protein [Deltaproteobacteria bacterium]|nr:DUF364 domain-containing protein [Deltaproteobacteria bacterium]
MGIAQRIREELVPLARGTRVKEVRVGLTYTAVMLEDARTGVAFTFPQSVKKGCRLFSSLTPLAGRDTSEVLNLLESGDEIEMAVGIATANALANARNEGVEEGDIMEYLSIQPGDKVGMVGHFAPLLPKLREAAAKVLIFERIRERQGDLLPEQEAFRILPECQIALITATSILNHTLERLLGSVRSCRQVVVLGATTPLVSSAFEGTPVTLLSGIVVTDPEGILRIVSEGGGMRLFKGHIRKVNLKL